MGRRKFDAKGKQRRRNIREDDASWRVTHLLTAAQLMSHDSPNLSRFFMRTSSQIGRRINMTMDCMTVKRNFCKKCHTLLIPNGPTPCRVRVSPKRETHVIVTCGHCGYIRRYLARTLTEQDSKEDGDSGNVEKITVNNKQQKNDKSQKSADQNIQNKSNRNGKENNKSLFGFDKTGILFTENQQKEQEINDAPSRSLRSFERCALQ